MFRVKELVTDQVQYNADMNQEDNTDEPLELTDDESLEEKEGKVNIEPRTDFFDHSFKSEPCEKLIESPYQTKRPLCENCSPQPKIDSDEMDDIAVPSDSDE